MRPAVSRALRLSFFLALSGCFPKLEGATCTTDLHCPSAQTCLAGACVERCDLPCEEGLVCGFHSGAAACECPAPASEAFFVDPEAGLPPGTAPYPSGAQEPARCRFSRVEDGLAAAEQYVSAPGGRTELTARVVTSAAAETRVYVPAAAGSFTVKPRITLVSGSEPVDPARHVLQGAAGSTVVVVEEGGALEGFTVRSALESSGGVGVGVSCGAQVASTRLASVHVSGELRRRDGTSDADAGMAAGIALKGDCELEVAESRVAQAQAGLAVQAPGARVTVRRSELARNLVGLFVQGGQVALESSLLLDNREAGILVPEMTAGAVDVSFSGGGVKGLGVGVQMAPGALGEVRLTDTELSTLKAPCFNQQGGTSVLTRVKVEGCGTTLPELPPFPWTALAVQTGGRMELVDSLVDANLSGVSAQGAGTRVAIRGGAVSGSTQGAGVLVAAGAALTLDRVRLEGNAGSGVAITGASTLAIEGGTVVTANGYRGVEVARGGPTVQLNGTAEAHVEVSRNGAEGLSVTDAWVHARFVDLTDNGGPAVVLSQPPVSTVPPSGPVTFESCSFRAPPRLGAPLFVFEDGSSRGLVVRDSRFVGGLQGLKLGGVGPLEVSLLQSEVSGASSGGLLVKTDVAGSYVFRDNRIFDNQVYLDPAGSGAQGGGALFMGPLPRVFNFTGNRLERNTGPQLGIHDSAGSPSRWVVGSRGECDAQSNVLTCYDRNSNFGFYSNTQIEMRGTSWQVDQPVGAPMPPRDYVLTPTGSMLETGTCPATPCVP